MATFDEFYKSLDPDDNVRGEQFEKKFAKWFLETDTTTSNSDTSKCALRVCNQIIPYQRSSSLLPKGLYLISKIKTTAVLKSNNPKMT